MSAGTLLNTSVGAYRLVDFLGAGGMGEVYRAVHMSLGRVVALKVLTAVGADAVSLERFRNEARVHATLQHPNIATLFDFLDQGGRPCIVMEYVDGETLDQAIRRRGALPVPEALADFAAVADAVGYLHGHGIIHRDIKSNNVKISSAGVVKLLDFGIAKAAFSPTLTVTGSVIGTIHYLAPEQLARGGADPRSDVWALGVLLYEMVTGRLPFDGPGSLADRISRAAYTPASRVSSGVTREVDTIIGRCLRRRPEERYQSAGALLANVRALLTASGRTAETAPEPLGRRGAGHWVERGRQHLLQARAHLRGAAAGAWLTRLAAQWRLAAAVAAAGCALLLLVWALGGRDGATVVAPPVDSATAATATPDLGAPRLATVRIGVRGSPALVYREGRFLNGTPLDLREQVGEQVRLTLERAGYQPLQVEFTVTGDTAYEFDLPPLPAVPLPRQRPDSAVLCLLLLRFPWRRRAAGGPDAGGARSPPTGEIACIDPHLRIEAALLSDPGCVREVNEDSIRVIAGGPGEQQRGYLAVVADGMGGHLAGEIASRLAIDEIEKSWGADDGDPSQALARALSRANAAILAAARADPSLEGMGTTCTALAIRDGLAYCAHVGDSRLYLVRAGELLQMTEDHSAVMELVRKGVLTREEARHHPDRNIILRALGSRSDVEVSLWPRPFTVRAGDRFVLCSDGLYDEVEEEEILARVGQGTPANACRELVALARRQGAPDNVSVAIVALHSADLQPDPPGLKQTRAGGETVP